MKVKFMLSPWFCSESEFKNIVFQRNSQAVGNVVWFPFIAAILLMQYF